MAVKVLIPSTLRTLTNNETTISLDGAGTVGDCLSELEAKFPGIGERLRDEDGEIRRFVNIYVNGDDVRFLEGTATALKAGDELSIVPAMAGGA
ncbi:MAG TPA: ubiquitin-like small modifier protein 1 [Chloroflexota bacterium]|nr:ubiquitin-like small modifier protein 1 [Chloroflexota bacterium]